MKFLLSLFMIPCFILAGLAGLMTLFVCTDPGIRPDAAGPVFHAYMSALHLSMALGLILSLLNGVYAAGLCVYGFIAKTWIGAAVAGGIGFGMFWCLFRLMEINL